MSEDSPLGEQDAPREKPRKQHRLIDWVPEGGLSNPDVILDRFTRWATDASLSLYDAQEEALLEIMTNKHVVLSTPTGSGKSLVALGMHFKAMCEGKRSFYTAPIKALVSEKFFALCDEFGADNVGMMTGDASMNGGAPIICCTQEILTNMALREGAATDAPYVIMDEFHYFGDRSRGWAWQVPILELTKSCFLLMSATLGNTATIEERIEERTGREVAHVHSDERPVPLDWSYRETPAVETVESLLEAGREPIYMVHFTQRDAAEQAQGLTGAQITTREERQALAKAIGGFRFDSPYGKDIQRFLKFGVGLHHAGILPKYRLLVEQLAQQGLLKVICGTDTLGVGVNIPIRTVLFTKLSKFDGEKVGILSVRDFKQIAGRAGRRGFDTEGSVVCQAPEHVIENLRSATKAAAKGKKKEKKKPPPRGFVGWTKEAFEGLIEKPPEILRSQLVLTHSALIALLQRGQDQNLPGSGYREFIAMINHSFETPARRARLRREAAVLFRALRQANVVQVEKQAGGPALARVDENLQSDFDLHHTLSLYLIDAVAALEPESPDYAVDVLSVVEAILENPRALLDAQVRQRKTDLINALKAERVPYEERMEKLEEVTWDKPNSEFLYATFNIFSAHHPWVGEDAIRPKSIFREMWEGFLSFEDYVRRYGIARLEGVLLRYLSQVHSTLARNLPESARNDEILEVIAFLRALLARVDSSLVEEWENLVDPKQPAVAENAEEAAPQRAPRKLDRRSFEARARAEMHQFLRALSKRDFEAAAMCLAGDDWDPSRIEREATLLFEKQETLRIDPEARRGHWTRIESQSDLEFDVIQTLIDEEGEGDFQIEARIQLEAPQMPTGPMLQLVGIRE